MRTVLLSLIVAILPSLALAEEISVQVTGMTCGACAASVKDSLKGDAAVQDVSVDLKTKVVHITTKGEAKLADETIKKHISDAGFSVQGIERTA